MNNSSPTKLILASLFLAFISLKLKEEYYYFFLAVIFLGLVFLVLGIYKWIKQR